MMVRGQGDGSLDKKVRKNGSHYWELNYSDENGDPHRIRLGANKELAEARRAQIILERDRLKYGLTPMHRECFWAELLPDYLFDSEHRRRNSQAHVVAAGKAIRRVLEYCGHADASKVTVADLRRWQRHRGREVAASTANKDLVCLTTFFNWCVAEGHLDRNVVPKVGSVGGKKVRIAYVMDDGELARLLAAFREVDRLEAARGTGTRFPQELPARFLSKVGLRWNEMRKLDGADPRPGLGVLPIAGEIAKNDEERLFPIDDELAELLEWSRSAFQATTGRPMGPRDPLMPAATGKRQQYHTSNFARIFHRAREIAGLAREDNRGRRLHIHSLRHTWATRLLRAGVPIVKVQALGGWKTLDVLVEIYNHVSAEDARAQIAALPLPDFGGGDLPGHNREQIVTSRKDELSGSSEATPEVAYSQEVESGGDEGSRTPDLRIANPGDAESQDSADGPSGAVGGAK